MKSFLCTAVVLSITAGNQVARAEYVPGAALINPGLAGNTQYDGWVGLNAANYAGYGSFPGTAAWPGAIGSNRTNGNAFNRDEPGDATLNKLANGTGGGPFLAGGSIYFGGFSSAINNGGGSLAVSDATPVNGLKNVVFQVQIGEAWTYDFWNHALPVLSYNGGAQQLLAATALVIDQFDNGTVTMPTGEERVYINTHLLQWDLSGISEPITDFRVEFTGVQHAQVYGMRLDQSNVYSAIPAPGSLVLLSLGGLMASRRKR